MEAPKVFRFGDYTLDQIRGSFLAHGREVELRPKTYLVLQYLVENPGRLLSKDDILKAVWPNIFVTEDSLVRCIHEARLALGDGEQRLIRTVPRRGYLFDLPVSVADPAPAKARESGQTGVAVTAPDSRAAAPESRAWRVFALIGIAALVVAGFAAHHYDSPASHDAASIAILPFDNLSGDAGQQYFSDGITDDLITRISGFTELQVLARNSSFAYRDTKLRASEVGRELNVRYLLAGSVRRDESRVRISAQLVNAVTEEQVWAKQYDRPVQDIFAVQDEVTQEIAATLASGIRVADLARTAGVPVASASAYELTLRAREVSLRIPTPESTREARELAQRAIQNSPDFAPAHVLLGRTYYREYALEWAGPEALDLASQAAQRAIALDQTSAGAYELLGRVYLRRGQHENAIATLRKAIALNPNMADSYASLADALTFAGRSRDAIPLVEKAMRLDPFYPPQIDMYLGRALYFDRRYAEAALALEACAARAPRFRPCYMYLAPVYAELGRSDDAQKIVMTLLDVSPGFTVSSSVRRHLPFEETALTHYIDGLRKAGVPN